MGKPKLILMCGFLSSTGLVVTLSITFEILFLFTFDAIYFVDNYRDSCVSLIDKTKKVYVVTLKGKVLV